MKNKTRCSWCLGDNQYISYHDNEWGKPVFDDQKLFELLMLEIFQAGLKWHTILKKRVSFNKAFDNFNFKKIANYNTHKINSLMSNTNIIRNKLKILSTISNAKCLIQVRQNHKGFYNYINKIKISLFNKSYQENSIDTGLRLSKIVYQRMRNDKFKFIGPIIINSFLMSSGFINGHESNCFMYYENQNGKSSSSSD